MVRMDIFVRLGDDKTLLVHQNGTAFHNIGSDITPTITTLFGPQFRLSLLPVKTVNFIYVTLKENIADLLTKPLTALRHQELAHMMEMTLKKLI
jgi:hypothetical protein